MKVIKSQLFLYGRALRAVRNLLRSSVHMVTAELHEALVKGKIARCYGPHLKEKPEIIQALQSTSFAEEPVRISFIASVRSLGNPDHRLIRFLDSVLAHAADIRQLEVLLGIDSDDDIDYYLSLQQRYGIKLRLRIFVAPVRYGYEGLHLYDKFLIPFMSKNSRMMCDCSDDVVVVLKGFDTELLAIDALYPDNLYFIHTHLNDRGCYIGDESKEYLRLLFIIQSHHPYSFVPAISKGVIDLAEQALQTLPLEQRKNWSPVANAWITDCYADVLSNLVKAEGLDRIHAIASMQRSEYDIYLPYQVKRDANKLSASDRAFLTMVGTETQEHLKLLASLIAKSAKPAVNEIPQTREQAGAA